MNGYDFDKTIYKGDCFVNFYLFCFKKFPYIIILLPFQIIMFIFVFSSRKLIKEVLGMYLILIPNKTKQIDLFWDKNICKIEKWYLNQKRENDVIISASPEFLLFPICKRLNIKNVIATKMNVKTGKIAGKNCWGEEKCVRFRNLFPETCLFSFYSDSLSDKPMMKLSQNGYLVNKGGIRKIT